MSLDLFKNFIRSKMINLFAFPTSDNKIDDNHVIYSYLGLSIMSKYISMSETKDIEDNYYFNHRELLIIGQELINIYWVNQKDESYYEYAENPEKEKNKVKNQLILNIEKKLKNFGHLDDMSLVGDSHVKKYVTHDEYLNYKGLTFKLGMPISLNNRILSGHTFLEPFNPSYEELEISYGLDVKTIINIYKMNFAILDEPNIMILDIYGNDSYKNSWVAIDRVKNFEINIARKKVFNYYEYYLCEKKNDLLKGKKIEKKTFLDENNDTKRLIFYFKSLGGKPFKFLVKDLDDNFIDVILPTTLPDYEECFLYNIGFPVNKYEYCKRFFIRKEFETLVIDLLRGCFLEVEKK